MFAADVVFGPWSDGSDWIYYVQPFLGPPVIALLFVPRQGRRAAWIAAGGVIVALTVGVSLFLLLAAALSSGES